MIRPVLDKIDFGEVDGQKVHLYSIGFPGKLEAFITNYGGILTSLSVPDRSGKLDDIVLGYNDLNGYLKETPYFGAIVGRFANRIANGSFELNGDTYSLDVNNGPNHLHGGLRGFDKVVWDVTSTLVENNLVKIVLEYISPDGEEGYPGLLHTTVTYIFTETGFEIRYKAETDKSTVLNLTQHSYFNLSGDFNNTILDHELLIKASRYLPVNEFQIPTGELAPVMSTPFDFINRKPVGKDIEANNQQLNYGSGYDHCWVFDNGRSTDEVIAALYHQESGRYMEVFTTEPGVQFYSGNFLENTIPGKNGIFYKKRSGLCLETQHFPDSPNQSQFPGVVLNPGEVFESKTSYQFSVK